MSSKIREGGEIRGVSGVDRSVVDSSSKRTRVLSEGERDETRNARREREKENTLRSDQKLVMLIDANMFSSTRRPPKYRKLSLQSACVGENKGQNERTHALTLRQKYEGNVRIIERNVLVTMRRR